MDEKQIFNKHYSRIRTEGILRSAIYGAAVCFGLNIIFALLYWMLAFGGVLLSLGIGVAAGALTGVLLYFLKYKPTDIAVARRLDGQGLEERMITMLEFKNDSSYIAERQRRDARERLNETPEKYVRYKISRASIAVAAAMLAISVGASVLGILASLGKIPYGKDIILGNDGTLSVEYIAAEGGRIVGNGKQSVISGGDTAPVLAVADDGWRFVSWDDGEDYPERQEIDVMKSTVITAMFEKIDGDTDPEDEGDEADDTPTGETTSDSGGGDSDDLGGENQTDGEEGSGGAKWQDKNQFIDGATYYRDYLELYYQYAAGILDENTEIPPEVIEFFETYFNGI